jgi:hypothetical protein
MLQNGSTFLYYIVCPSEKLLFNLDSGAIGISKILGADGQSPDTGI